MNSFGRSPTGGYRQGPSPWPRSPNYSASRSTLRALYNREPSDEEVRVHAEVVHQVSKELDEQARLSPEALHRVIDL
tara:strand:- start:3020 stop:3250 length:231 start_codon:yes stop_codon:yes gene_type:complete